MNMETWLRNQIKDISVDEIHFARALYTMLDLHYEMRSIGGHGPEITEDEVEKEKSRASDCFETLGAAFNEINGRLGDIADIVCGIYYEQVEDSIQDDLDYWKHQDDLAMNRI